MTLKVRLYQLEPLRGIILRRRYVAQWRTRDREAILAELDRVAAEYAEAQREWESACVRFQAARERFAGIKRIASGAGRETAPHARPPGPS